MTVAVTGYLAKRSQHIKIWKRRYFTFADGMLVSRKDERFSSKVLSEDRVFDVLYWGGRPHGLCLQLRCGRRLYVTARSEAEATRWHDAVESYLREKQRQEDMRRLLCRQQLPAIRESMSEARLVD